MAFKDAMLFAGSMLAGYWFLGKVTMLEIENAWDAMPPEDAAVDVVARTIWGEARGEGVAGMEAVASVIRNRVNDRRWSNTWRGVCLQAFQFSAWNLGDPNRERMLAVTLAEPSFQAAWDVARRCVDGTMPDRVGGATHYHVRGLNVYWAKGAEVAATIGSHVFYRGVA